MRHFRHISANSCTRGCTIIEDSSAEDLSRWEQAFPPRAWAAGEDYNLGERVRDLRRDGRALAGRVAGLHGDYWVRVGLDLPLASACDCGRPRCRHAAAVLQAYHARRLPVTDVGRLVDAFLDQPRRDPLAAAAMGEDFVGALALPALAAQDIWALGQAERLLALDRALRASPDPGDLLLRAMREADGDQALATLLAATLATRPPGAAVWPLLVRRAPDALADLLADLRPPDLSPAACLAALWGAAADGDGRGLRRLAPHAVALAPASAYPALEELAGTFPDLLADLLEAARASRRLGRAVARLLRRADGLPAAEAAALERRLAAWDGLPRHMALALQVRRAARDGGAPQLLAARRAAQGAGLWPRLRGVALRLLRQRADGPALETQLLLAEGDLTEAARIAEHCRSSALPERLVAQALRATDPARARQHELRAEALEQHLAAAERSPGQVRRRPGKKS